MKNIKTLNTVLFAILAFCFVTSAMAQEKEKKEFKTLLGNHHYSNGAYGALMINYTQINNDDILLIGARGGIIINQSITIGLAGYGLASDNEYKILGKDIVNLAGGYGGLLIEPIVGPRLPVHLAFPIIIGAGGIAYISDLWSAEDDEYHNNVYDSDAFFVIEPGIEIEMNLTRFMRIGLAATYRYTSKINLPERSEDFLRGFNFGLSMKFGKFWSNRSNGKYY
jgi:hypothetical protein